MAGQTTYEVSVLQGGRWEIHSRYNAMQKDDAIQEAMSLGTTPGIEATKVIREVYDPKEGLAEEYTVYKSESARSKPSRPTPPAAAPARSRSKPGKSTARGTPARAAPAGDRETATRPRQRRPKAKPRATLISVLVKLMLVILMSVAVASLMAGIGAAFLPHTQLYGISLSGPSRDNFLIVIFIVGFVLTAVLSFKSFLSKVDLAAVGERKGVAAPQPAPRARQAGQADVLKHIDVTLPPSAEEPPPAGEEAPAEADDAPEKEDETKKEEEEKEEAKTAAADLSPNAEQQKRYMMKFLGDSLAETKDAHKSLDNFNKFGVNLYLAGACEAIAKKKNLDESEGAGILSDGVQVMGFNKQSADSFAQKKEEYLLADSRYMQMYQAGRNAMNTSLEGDSAAPNQLDKSLTEWNKPKAKEENTGPITVMFTDMVGSTALTQDKGDAVAQEVVRAHNRVVRDALSRCAGREIKHTGDGIMASFDTTSNSVEASMLIQRGARAHSVANPDLPLKLKIGINAGEPIAEDDDLFGTTVQLSARIVDKAGEGETYVSEIVRGICAGKELGFRSVGQFDMKGFPEPITLFEVLWDTEDDDAAAGSETAVAAE